MASGKNKRILFQTALIIFLLFGAAVIINGIAIYNNGTVSYLDEIKNNKNSILTYVHDVMDSYSSISWLVDYWQKNYENIDASHTPVDSKKYKDLPSYVLLDKKSITPQQAQELSPEHQRLFAEYCYKEFLETVDKMSANFNFYDLYCVKHLIETKNAFLFFRNVTDKNNDDEKSSLLGDFLPFNMQYHPVIQNIYATKKGSEEFEHTVFKDDENITQEFLYGFEPVIFDNEIACVIVISFHYTDVKNAIKNNVKDIEIKNILFLVLSGIILSFVLRLIVLKPLLKVQESVRNYSKNRDSLLAVDEMKKIKSRNEIGRLADDFSNLAVELDRYTKETAKLSAEKARIDSELSLAATIQEDALPKNFPDNDKFKIYASITPAKEVGGDLYDFFMIDDDHMALVIGDVSGKGISASLFMMKVKSLLQYAVFSNKNNPEKIITSLNEKLCEENDAMMFITLWFGIMTISTGEIVYVNAGHEYPVLKQDNKFEFIKRQHLLPLGTSEKAKFSVEHLQLGKGDILFLYTDGVAEANNEAEELFGLDRLLEALNENPELDPKELTANVLKKINEFVGDAPQFDDTTILCVRY